MEQDLTLHLLLHVAGSQRFGFVVGHHNFPVFHRVAVEHLGVGWVFSHHLRII